MNSLEWNWIEMEIGNYNILRWKQHKLEPMFQTRLDAARPEFEAVELIEGDLAQQLYRNRAHVLVPPASLPEQLRRRAETRHAR